MLIWEKVHVFRMYIHISIYSVYFFTNQPDSSPYDPVRKTVVVFFVCFFEIVYIYWFIYLIKFFLTSNFYLNIQV